MKKNILIVGEKFSNNLGDGIICDTVEKLLEDDDFEQIILDISGRVKYTDDNNKFRLKSEYITYIKSYIKKFLHIFGCNKMGKNLLKIYNDFIERFNEVVVNKKIDVVVFAGGQMFIDTFVNQINYICEYCSKNDIMVIFNCCGGGKVLNKKVLNNILNNNSVKYISVRDNYDYLSKMSKKKIIKCCDSAILSSRIYNKNEKEKIKYGIGIMFSTLQSPKLQINFWKKMLKLLIENNIDFKVFTNGSAKDYSFAKYILSEMGLNQNVYLDKKPNNPNDLIEIVTKYEKILSMRLHSMIVAYSFNIPIVSISWDNKVNTFFNEIGLNDCCFNMKSNKNDIMKKLLSIGDNSINLDIKNQIERDIDSNFELIKKIIKDND